MRTAVLVLLCLPQLAAAERKWASPSRVWVGEFADGGLRRGLPRGGVVTDAKAFAKLWKAWRPEEKVPEVDFAREFAVVLHCARGFRLFAGAVLRDGQLSVISVTERGGRGGYGYAILTLSRKGVKKANGVPLTKPKPEEPPEK